jgi:predicted GNAT family N-acyltransferase
MENVTIREIAWDSPEYKSSLELRNRILRIPLGLDIMDDDLSGEGADTHICAFREGELVGILVLTRAGEASVRMRQVAVREDLWGQNIGRRLVEYAEELARSQGFKEMILHARRTAEGFYLKLGYAITRSEFYEVGIPHVEMRKAL